MSVIDKVLQGQPTEAATFTLREAAVTVLVAAVASDGTVAPAEGARLNALLSSMRLYRQVPPAHLQHLIEHALEVTAHTPPEELMAACAAVIPEEVPVQLEPRRAVVSALLVLVTAALGTALTFRRIARVEPASAIS